MSDAIARPSLKKRMMKAGGWSMMGVVVNNVLRLVSNLVVTRFVLPEAFGLMMFISTVLVALNMISDVGIHRSIVREPDGGSAHFLRVAWTVKIRRGLAIGAGLCLIGLGMFLFAPDLAPPESVYADPRLPLLFVFTASVPILLGLESTTKELVARDLDYERLFWTNLASKLISMAVVIAIALISPTVWALISGMIMTNVVLMVASHLFFKGPKMRWTRDAEIELRMWTFGKYILGSSFFTLIGQYADRLILAALLSAHHLGLYSIAFLWASAGTTLINRLLDAVAYSAIAEVVRERIDELPQFFSKIQRLVDLFCIVAASLCFALGPWLISFLYPEDFSPAGDLLRYLSLMLLAIRFQVINTVLVNLGDSKSMMVSNAIRAVTICIALPLGFHFFGIKGALLAITLSPLASQPYLLARARHDLGDRLFHVGWAWVLGIAVFAATLAYLVPLDF